MYFNQNYLKALSIGMIGSFIIACSSVYVALRLGALPWAILFATVLSFTFLRKILKTDLGMVNVAHTTMTAGSMVAGSVAFVVPAFWRLNVQAEVSKLNIVVVILIGIAVALFLSYKLRTFLIEKTGLNYPIGNLAYDTIISCENGGGNARLMFVFMALMALFTIARDYFHVISTALILPVLGKIFISPMASSMGYVLGYKFALFWGISAIITAFVKTYSGIELAVISDFSLGLMLGSGLGFLVFMLFKQRVLLLNLIQKTLIKLKQYRSIMMLLAIFLGYLFIYVKASLLIAIFIFMLVLVAILASLLVGEGGINPFEVLGVISTLALVLFFNLDKKIALLAILLGTITCALTGDMMNDYKAGFLLKTNAKAMMLGEALGALVGVVGSLGTLFFILNHSAGGLDNVLYPAPQSMAIATFLQKDYSIALIIGFGLAFFISVFNKIPMLGVALGAYVGSSMGMMILLGGILALVSQKHNRQGKLISAGILAGEGFTATVLALIAMSGI